MNVLYVTFGLPAPPDSGARLRDFNLLKRVSKHHRVWLLSLLEFEDELRHAEALAPYCEKVDGVVAGRGTAGTLAMAIAGLFSRRPVAVTPFWYPELARKITALTRRQDFDIVQIEHSFLAPYRSALASEFVGVTVLSLHNIGVQQYRSILDMNSGFAKVPAAFKWWLMRGWEAKAASKFDRLITVSSQDRRRLLELGVSRDITVVDNGVDCSQLQPLPRPQADSAELLFIGTMGYLPNRDAARFFCREVLPLVRRSRPDCRLNVVGSGGRRFLSDLHEPGVVEVTGRVEDPIPYYARSQIAVVPLRSGGGSRLKILESMALARPVVSTTLGREGLDLVDGSEVLTADTAADFAECILRLLEYAELRERVADAGRRRVEAQYDWDLLAERLLESYDRPGSALRRHE